MKLIRAQAQLASALNYRIQRGTMSCKLLSTKTGLGQSHVSNFLHSKRGLSLESMDRILTALELQVELVPARHARERA